MKLFLAALALLLIVGCWFRQLARPVVADPAWLEDDDGVQPVDPRTAALAAAEARGWMTAAEEDIVHPGLALATWGTRYSPVDPRVLTFRSGDYLSSNYPAHSTFGVDYDRRWAAEYDRHQATLKG